MIDIIIFAIKTMPRLRIWEAVESYNSKLEPDKPKMLMKDLALYVYRDKKTIEKHKLIRFYRFAKYQGSHVDMNIIKDICDFTNVDLNFLIDFNDGTEPRTDRRKKQVAGITETA